MFLLNLLGKTAMQIKPEEMNVFDHLEELRWRLIRGVVVVLVFTAVAFIFMPEIFQHVILAHANPKFWTYRMLCKIDPGLCVDHLNFTLQSRDMAGQFTIHLKTAFIMGFIGGFPYIVWEIWRYIKPALLAKERSGSFAVLSIVPFLFVIGIAFGYYVLAPLSVNFLANYQIDSSIVNQFDITSYVSTVCMLVLACGLIFQLPILIHFLSIAGIITPAFMKKYRRHAIVIIFVLAGIITPSPDMLSQVIVALPIYLLYEISILTSGRVQKNKIAMSN